MKENSYVLHLPSFFTEVRKYVRDGLPQDHFSREGNNFGKKRKVWHDTDSDGNHEYDDYKNDEVRDAARFRDGLVSDIYKEFSRDFGFTIWADEYKKHSEVVFRFLAAKEWAESGEVEKHCECNSHAFGRLSIS